MDNAIVISESGLINFAESRARFYRYVLELAKTYSPEIAFAMAYNDHVCSAYSKGMDGVIDMLEPQLAEDV